MDSLALGGGRGSCCICAPPTHGNEVRAAIYAQPQLRGVGDALTASGASFGLKVSSRSTKPADVQGCWSFQAAHEVGRRCRSSAVSCGLGYCI